MSRKMIDCSQHPSANNCSLAMAGEENDLMTAAVDHATRVHGEKDSPELREWIKSQWVDVAGPGPFGIAPQIQDSRGRQSQTLM